MSIQAAKTATPALVDALRAIGRTVVALSPGYYEIRIDGRYAGRRVEGTEQDAWDVALEMAFALAYG